MNLVVWVKTISGATEADLFRSEIHFVPASSKVIPTAFCFTPDLLPHLYQGGLLSMAKEYSKSLCLEMSPDIRQWTAILEFLWRKKWMSQLHAKWI